MVRLVLIFGGDGIKGGTFCQRLIGYRSTQAQPRQCEVRQVGWADHLCNQAVGCIRRNLDQEVERLFSLRRRLASVAAADRSSSRL